MTGGPIGMIAGRGVLPVEIAEGAHREGRRVVCVNVFDADPRLRTIADDYETVGLGRLGAMVATLRAHGVREVVLAGKVDKLAAAGSVSLDELGMLVASRLTDFGDASILAALVRALEDAGFVVAPQARYTPHLVAAPGVLGRRAPSSAEEADIAFGMRIAAAVAALDIGQAVAVRRGMVIAVEAAEGTDAMIARAGRHTPGAVVVKVGRPRQDPRYDLPAVGPHTAAALAAARGAVLAVEAQRTLLLERDRLIAQADDAGIALVAVPPARG
ncbi:MAG TPA: UDP-2,3-diacylglucosamine diphosphatase LpxI [bacterium]|nr:UDP-2,3-diacylglucosamine diphosphatase LpxI [bacterium]